MRLCRMAGAAAVLSLLGASAGIAGGDGGSYNASAQTRCDGVFSNGTRIDVSDPKDLADVPGKQTFCDFHTFGWNQFLWLVESVDGQPRFMGFAPWYNMLSHDPALDKPAPYPGGSTALKTALLDKTQAGSGDELIDVDGQLVRYDIRYDETAYNFVVRENLYDKSGYDKACDPDDKGVCANNVWLPPNGTDNGNFMELKTSWRTFDEGECPEDEMFCEGDFGLVGMHIVEKTPTHGESIWVSMEHIANVPDCEPGHSLSIAETGPDGMAWNFFDPKTAPDSVMKSKTCNVTGDSPQCNGDPNKDGKTRQVNVCRTDMLPAGGASDANCAVVPSSEGDKNANSKGNVACLNASLRPKLEGPWGNYHLIGTLWTKPGQGPTQDFRIKVFQDEEKGLSYVDAVGLPHLANATMETYLQVGATGYDPLGNNATQAGCFFCHNLPDKSYQMDLSHFPTKLDASVENLKSAH
ncbi:hypothetical protein DRB17_10420 [Ferruginivarius sediminum]|uniref:Cytochrome c-552/DMSO reductase-like haem-binding domain-containing protein n=2 Tax=Ferruginivarius sediminum TaxID=2661937 RepID=A0A369TCK5_9PROT|nr:hypothetical protein DRB17_10420 [Ferruginivarius sediminum]